MSQKVIIYPGTFDPLTYGHIDIIERGARLGDQLIVAVSLNLGKQPLFSIEERTQLVEAEVARINGANKAGLPVLVKSFSGLLTDFATQQGQHLFYAGFALLLILNMNFKWPASISGFMANWKQCFLWQLNNSILSPRAL